MPPAKKKCFKLEYNFLNKKITTFAANKININ